MTTNKRHSRGGLKPLRQRKKINKGFRELDNLADRRVANCERVDAWKREHQQRHAENLAAAALSRYKATADEQAAWHDRGGQIIAREPGVRPPFVVADRLDERPWARLTTAPAQAKREDRRLVRRFNPLAMALCVALIGGDE